MPSPFFYIALFVVLGVIAADQAKAVPPPDFIFNVGSQMAQFFSIAFLFLSAVASSLYQFMRLRLVDSARRRGFIAICIGVILILAGGGAWGYGKISQQKAYDQWTKLSAQFKGVENDLQDPVIEKGDGLAPTSTMRGGSDEIDDGLDQLALNGTVTATSVTRDIPLTDDAVTSFVRRYYQLIASHQFNEAYQLSKRSVSLSTFASWYTDVSSVTIDKIQRIDAKRSSLELTLEEKGVKTRYGVLMDVVLEAGKPVRIEQSMVRVLANASSSPAGGTPTTNSASAISYFDQQNKRVALDISNEGFQAVLDKGHQPFVVDAREDVEYENGHFPGVNHIRFADLKAGRWIELPQDQPVYVFCWSGIRGKEVAEFLRKKKILASYLDHGANGWVFFGGKWEGNINFAQKYTEAKYQNTFTTDQVRNKMKEGVVLIDSRSPGAYAKWHVPGSLSLSLISTPSIALPAAYDQIPHGSRIISICDDYVNCFDAKLIGVELERRGHVFLGRYNRPWEMR